MSGNTAADREYARIPGYEHFAPPDPLQVLFDNWMSARIVVEGTRAGYEDRIGDAITFFDHRKVETWTLEDGRRYIEYLRTKRGNSNTVIIEKLMLLKRVLSFGCEDGLIQRIPFNFRRLPRLHREKLNRVPFTWEQHNRLLASLTPTEENPEPNGHYFWPNACRVAWHTGLRMSDVALMPLDAIKFDRMVVQVLTKKKRTRKEKLEIPIEPDFKPVLEKLLENGKTHHQPFVFPAMAQIYTTRRTQLIQDFRRQCDAVGFQDHSFHSYRHGFITRLINAGVDSLIICAITGNSLREIQSYSHVSDEAKAKALAMSRLAFSQPSDKPAQVIELE